MVPAPAGHIALGGLVAAAASCSSGFCPQLRRTARSIPAAAGLRAAPSPRRRRRAPWRTPPAGGERPYGPSSPCRRRLLPRWVSAFPRRRSSEQQPTGAGGQRGGGYARGAPLRGESPAPVAESATISLPAFTAEGGGSKGGWDVTGEESRPNFIYQRRLEFIGSCLSRGAGIPHGLKGCGGWGLGLPTVFRGFTEDDPEHWRLSPWWRAGKKLAADSCYSPTSPKGQRSPENFRECMRVGVCSSLPKCRESELKVRHMHLGPDPRV